MTSKQDGQIEGLLAGLALGGLVVVLVVGVAAVRREPGLVAELGRAQDRQAQARQSELYEAGRFAGLRNVVADMERLAEVWIRAGVTPAPAVT